MGVVGMPLEGELAVGLLDFGFCGLLSNSQDGIVVLLFGALFVDARLSDLLAHIELLRVDVLGVLEVPDGVVEVLQLDLDLPALVVGLRVLVVVLQSLAEVRQSQLVLLLLQQRRRPVGVDHRHVALIARVDRKALRVLLDRLVIVLRLEEYVRYPLPQTLPSSLTAFPRFKNLMSRCVSLWSGSSCNVRCKSWMANSLRWRKRVLIALSVQQQRLEVVDVWRGQKLLQVDQLGVDFVVLAELDQRLHVLHAQSSRLSAELEQPLQLSVSRGKVSGLCGRCERLLFFHQLPPAVFAYLLALVELGQQLAVGGRHVRRLFVGLKGAFQVAQGQVRLRQPGIGFTVFRVLREGSDAILDTVLVTTHPR